ncbi:MAG: sigma-70 family RNA polymerase sigma factor [Polyangiaceae bacterium]|nr:sigma-70 family RNA polymerase sigma factor [Polyangiaceae bacterium]
MPEQSETVQAKAESLAISLNNSKSRKVARRCKVEVSRLVPVASRVSEAGATQRKATRKRRRAVGATTLGTTKRRLPERALSRAESEMPPPNFTAYSKPHSDVPARGAEKLTQREADELVARYTALARQIAGGFQRKLPRNVLRDDLIAASMSGLWDAIRKHGHEKGRNFDWYVRVRIRGAILDELRAQDWLPRRARAAAAEAAAAGSTRSYAPVVLRFDEVSETDQARCLSTSTSSDIEATVAARFARQALEKAITQLPDRERRIVTMHYFRGVKFKDLGQMLGVSEPRISQLHSRAMARLRGILGEQEAA